MFWLENRKIKVEPSSKRPPCWPGNKGKMIMYARPECQQASRATRAWPVPRVCIVYTPGGDKPGWKAFSVPPFISRIASIGTSCFGMTEVSQWGWCLSWLQTRHRPAWRDGPTTRELALLFQRIQVQFLVTMLGITHLPVTPAPVLSDTCAHTSMHMCTCTLRHTPHGRRKNLPVPKRSASATIPRHGHWYPHFLRSVWPVCGVLGLLENLLPSMPCAQNLFLDPSSHLPFVAICRG